VRVPILLCLGALLGAGCKTHPEAAAAEPPKIDAAAAPAHGAAAPAAKSRPYGLYIPGGLDRSKPAPLVVFFHAYGSTGAASARGLGLMGAADTHGFVLAFPDGTVDSQGNRFWNATDACCNFDHTSVDDVAYATWLIDDVASKVSIDAKRVYVAGHSSGAFLSLRLACDRAPRIAAAVSFAGAGWKDASRCKPSEPVSILEIHGDADTIVRYGGGLLFDAPTREYPGAETTVAAWATRDRCSGPLVATAGLLDFDTVVPGAETTRKAATGCPAGISVDLWTVAGGVHQPNPTVAGLEAVWAWMAAHPKR
jgi:polyhydroxybutyrate depolymerase